MSLLCCHRGTEWCRQDHGHGAALQAAHQLWSFCTGDVPTTLVLQQMDGVESTFLWRLNQHAEKPDLTIILVDQPARSRGASPATRHLQPLPARRNNHRRD